MIKNMPVVDFLALRNLALTRVTGVVEAGVIELPGNTARPGTLDRVGQEFAGGSLKDRKSTRLNSSHQIISYAVFCLKKKNKKQATETGVTQSKRCSR